MFRLLNSYYRNVIQAEHLICIDCGCDVGGSVNNICDKETGQCTCRPRVNGRTCKEPLQTHYFPTLYQYQYEAEDGHTPANTPVRYGFNESVFRSYSWKGYAVFSQLQVFDFLFYCFIFNNKCHKFLFNTECALKFMEYC